MEENQNTQEKNGRLRTLLIILAVVVAVAIVWFGFWAWSTSQSTPVFDDEMLSLSDDENMHIVENIDFRAAETDAERLPPGFPTDMPINYENLNYSQINTYATGTNLNVSYYTEDSPAEVIAAFADYFGAGEYTFDVSELTEDLSIILATSESQSVMILVEDKVDNTYVQIDVTNS